MASLSLEKDKSVDQKTFQSWEKLTTLTGFEITVKLIEWIGSELHGEAYIEHRDEIARLPILAQKETVTLMKVKRALYRAKAWGTIRYGARSPNKTGWTAVDHTARYMKLVLDDNRAAAAGIFFRKEVDDAHDLAVIFQIRQRCNFDLSPSRIKSSPIAKVLNIQPLTTEEQTSLRRAAELKQQQVEDQLRIEKEIRDREWAERKAAAAEAKAKAEAAQRRLERRIARRYKKAEEAQRAAGIEGPVNLYYVSDVSDSNEDDELARKNPNH